MRISDWISDVCSSDLPSPTPHWVRTYSPKARRTARATCRELRARASGAPVCPALTFTVTRTSRTGDAPPGAICPLEVGTRSEEHTSELQSLMRISYAVFCLKKKNTTLTSTHTPHYISNAQL